MQSRRLDLPSLTAIRAFEVAARRQSFKDAADELCVTPAAISRQIKQLEAATGDCVVRPGSPAGNADGSGGTAVPGDQ